MRRGQTAAPAVRCSRRGWLKRRDSRCRSRLPVACAPPARWWCWSRTGEVGSPKQLWARPQQSSGSNGFVASGLGQTPGPGSSFVLAFAGRRILVNAGQLARRGVLEDLVRGLEVPLPVTAVPAVPDEVADDREDNHEGKKDNLQSEVHVALRSTIAAVPYATTSVIVLPISEESKRIITTAFAPMARAFSTMRSTAWRRVSSTRRVYSTISPPARDR